MSRFYGSLCINLKHYYLHGVFFRRLLFWNYGNERNGAADMLPVFCFKNSIRCRLKPTSTVYRTGNFVVIIVIIVIIVVVVVIFYYFRTWRATQSNWQCV